MHVELDIVGSKLSYVAGDHMAIFPINDSQLVERIGELLETPLDTIFTLTNVDGTCVAYDQALVYIYTGARSLAHREYMYVLKVN